MSLKKYSDDELLKEIQKRKELRDVVITPLDAPDFTDLITMCVSIVKEMHINKYEDEGNKHDIYEAAMEAVFGPKIWEWKKGQLE